MVGAGGPIEAGVGGPRRGFEYKGYWLEEGSMLKLLNTTANRDPAVFGAATPRFHATPCIVALLI